MRSEFSHPPCFICKTRHDASQYECFLFICFLFILLPSQRRRPNLHFWEMMLYIRRNSGCYHTDMSIIENIWPSATTLRRQQFHWGQPNITGNYRNGNRKSRLLCVLPGPIIILPICLRETQRFASERRMGAQKQRMWPQCYYWCVQTSAADCAAWSCPILDVRATQLLLEIQFFFCLRNWELGATFVMCDKGLRSKHSGLRSWSEARWDWYLGLRLPLIASWFHSGAEKLSAPMASVSKVSILDYFNIVFEGENGKIESNCKACGTRIQAKRSVTSNFVTHLKVTE